MKITREKIENVYGGVIFISFIPPMILLNQHHNCYASDECHHIMHNGEMGICVENAIDDMFLFLVIFWYMVAVGSAIVLSKFKNAISPFVLIGCLAVLAIWGAFVDPAKWGCVIALLISICLFVVVCIVDHISKREDKKLEDRR